MKRYVLIFASLLIGSAAMAEDKIAEWKRGKDKDSFTLLQKGRKEPVLTWVAPSSGRPYVHPLRAPDGEGVLTEYSPEHHKHQTGLFVGFVKLNGRDFFHNRGNEFFKKRTTASSTMKNNNRFQSAHFSMDYQLLDKSGEGLLREQQNWSWMPVGEHVRLDLRLVLESEQDVTLGKYDYGGLFLRMPWKQKTGGKAVNSEGDENAKAEGKAAKWVDVGMPIEGRKDWGHVAILDHKDNPRHPVLWRVDGQLGVGPALTRSGDYKLKKGDTLTLKYRLVVYTGELDKQLIEKAWKEFTDKKK
jgi:hypothetical protein